MKHNTYDKAFGIVLNLSQKEQSEFINNLQEDWFQSNLHKNIYQAITELSGSGCMVDLLNLTE